jgi:hypothetical protein
MTTRFEWIHNEINKLKLNSCSNIDEHILENIVKEFRLAETFERDIFCKLLLSKKFPHLYSYVKDIYDLTDFKYDLSNFCHTDNMSPIICEYLKTGKLTVPVDSQLTYHILNEIVIYMIFKDKLKIESSYALLKFLRRVKDLIDCKSFDNDRTFKDLLDFLNKSEVDKDVLTTALNQPSTYEFGEYLYQNIKDYIKKS